jgi:hypothetical protein
MEELEKIILKLEYILEADPRTLKTPECENSELFDTAYELLKIAKSLEKIAKE